MDHQTNGMRRCRGPRGRTRPRRRRIGDEDQVLVEGIYLPISKGGLHGRRLDDEFQGQFQHASSSESVVPSGKRRAMCQPNGDRCEEKDCDNDFRADFTWDGLVEPHNQLNIETQIMLREDYLKRIKAKCLPLVNSTRITKNDVQLLQEIAQLLDLYRESTVDVVENISEWAKRSQRSSLFEMTISASFLWKGRNYLLKIPADLDFMANLPSVAEALGIRDFQRNPFALTAPMSLPHATRCTALEENEQSSYCTMNSARILFAMNVVLNEEEIHGMVPQPVSVVTWKELDLAAVAQEKEHRQAIRAEKSMIPKLARIIAGEPIVHCFRRNDVDSDGMLMYSEFFKGVAALKCLAFESEDERQWLLSKVDPTKAGWVSYYAFNEACNWARRKHRAAKSVKSVPDDSDELAPPFSRSLDQVKSMDSSSKALPRSNSGRKSTEFDPTTNKMRLDAIRRDFDERIKHVQARKEKLVKELKQVRNDLESSGQETEFKIQLVREHQANIDASECSLTERLKENGRKYSRPHVEYPKANLLRLRKLLGDLGKWENELSCALASLQTEETNLKRQMGEAIDEVSRLYEIKRNREEELVMREQEKFERKRAAVERAVSLANKREATKKQEAKWREEQRKLRKRRARLSSERHHTAAQVIQQRMRWRRARRTFLERRWAKKRAFESLLGSIYFAPPNVDHRLRMRPSPLVLFIQNTTCGRKVVQQLFDTTGEKYWGLIETPQVAEALEPTATTCLVDLIQSALRTAPHVIIMLDHPMDRDFARSVRVSLQCCEPKPMSLYVGATSSKGVRKAICKGHVDQRATSIARWVRAAAVECLSKSSERLMNELECLGKFLIEVHEQNEIDADLDVSREAQGIRLLAQAVQLLTGASSSEKLISLSAAVELLRDPRRLLCQLLTVKPESSKKLAHELDTLMLSPDWFAVDYAQNPGLGVISDWVYASRQELSEQVMPETEKAHNLVASAFNLVLAPRNPENIVDSALQLALLELRVFQNIRPSSSDVFGCMNQLVQTQSRKPGLRERVVRQPPLLTGFRLDEKHLLFRCIRGGKVVYRAFSLENLAALIAAKGLVVFSDSKSANETLPQARALLEALRFSGRTRMNASCFSGAVPAQHGPEGEQPPPQVRPGTLLRTVIDGMVISAFGTPNRTIFQIEAFQSCAPFQEFKGTASGDPEDLLQILETAQFDIETGRVTAF